MSELMSIVIPLALGAAISPQVLAIAVILLGGKRAPKRNTAFMILGMVVVLGLITASAAGSIAQVPKEAGTKFLVYWLDIGFGALLFYLGVKGLLRKPDPNAPAKTVKERGGKSAGPVKFIVIGFAVMLADFSSLVLFIPGIRDVSASSVSLSGKIFAGAILYIAVLAPALIPLVAMIISPDKATRVMVSINEWLKKHAQLINAVLCFVFGLFLVIKGASNLL
jgi:hypothetical protein